jgi:hypothetical protein
MHEVDINRCFTLSEYSCRVAEKLCELLFSYDQYKYLSIGIKTFYTRYLEIPEHQLGLL